MMNLCHMGNMVMRIAFGTSSTTWQKCVFQKYKAGCCYVDYDDCDGNGVPVQFPPDNERNRRAVTTHYPLTTNLRSNNVQAREQRAKDVVSDWWVVGSFDRINKIYKIRI